MLFIGFSIIKFFVGAIKMHARPIFGMIKK